MSKPAAEAVVWCTLFLTIMGCHAIDKYDALQRDLHQTRCTK